MTLIAPSPPAGGLGAPCRPGGREVADVLVRHGLRVALQPIVSLRTGELEGVEALARFDDRLGACPESWFEAADELGRGRELELCAASSALVAWPERPEHVYVSINASPRTLVDSRLLLMLLAATTEQGRVGIEITEHASVEDYAPALDAMARLRAAGAHVAVDDLGAGFATFRHVLALRPDVVKIDRALVLGVSVDPDRRALVRSVVALARELRARVVAEGVETADDLAAVAELGVDAAQGYHIGEPSRDPVTWQRWLHRPLFVETQPKAAAG